MGGGRHHLFKKEFPMTSSSTDLPCQRSWLISQMMTPAAFLSLI
jgi:hypothetical protein